MGTDDTSEVPTLDEFLSAIDELARLVRAAFEKPGSVNRATLLSALERYEALERASRRRSALAGTSTIPES